MFNHLHMPARLVEQHLEKALGDQITFFLFPAVLAMWRPVARQASFLGAAAWFLTSGRSLAEPAVASKLTTGSATATEQPRQQNSTAAQSSQPPAALEEGTHFTVLSGVDGSSSKLGAVAAAIRNADVVLLGEYHDDSVAHALQLALLQHVAARLGHAAAPQPAAAPSRASGDSLNKPQDQQQQRAPSRPLILSLEMFETDVQPVLSEYLAGHIPLSDLMKDARWVGACARVWGPRAGRYPLGVCG